MNTKLAFLKERGVDIDSSLLILGDEATYNEILREFFNGFIDQMNAIKAAFEQKDWKHYTILVHTLKSNCKTFGCMKLSNMALEHQTHGETMDVNYINLHISEMFVEANNLYKLMDEYFKSI